MKTIKEIKDCIKKLKLLRTGMPHYSLFGDDNYKEIDTEINILDRCLKENLQEANLEHRLSNRLDEIDATGEDDTEDPLIKAYDWLLGKSEEELVTDEDIKVFCKKPKGKKRGK